AKRGEVMEAESARQQRTQRLSLTVGLFVDHAKAVRIPLLIILFGVVMTFRACAYVMAACLGFAVWHTARTVYRFNIPTIPTLADPWAEPLRQWLPRVLGAAIPL